VGLSKFICVLDPEILKQSLC